MLFVLCLLFFIIEPKTTEIYTFLHTLSLHYSRPISIPQVRKRRCQTGSISLSTEALTAALSKESETSRTARTAQIQRMPSAPSTVPVSSQPYHPPKASAKTVKISDPPKCLNIENAFCHAPLRAKI